MHEFQIFHNILKPRKDFYMIQKYIYKIFRLTRKCDLVQLPCSFKIVLHGRNASVTSSDHWSKMLVLSFIFQAKNCFTRQETQIIKIVCPGSFYEVFYFCRANVFFPKFNFLKTFICVLLFETFKFVIQSNTIIGTPHVQYNNIKL